MSDIGEKETLLYMYCIVPAETADPPDLLGLEGQPVRLVRGEAVAAVVSAVQAADYEDTVLDTRLSDLQWVGERGLAHERVLDWFLESGPVIPLSLFSLHSDEGRVRARIQAEATRFAEVLNRLRGRREWGIRLWRKEEELMQHLAELSPLLKALEDEIAVAAPGRRFLLAKKRDAARDEEARTLSRRVAHRLFAMLREVSDQATTLALPASVPEGSRHLLLHGAFLVDNTEFPAFQSRVSQLAHELGGVGFEVEFTGPWPPYHFVEDDGGR